METNRMADKSSTAPVRIEKVARDRREARDDVLAVEEPLAIRVNILQDGQRVDRDLSITMRTPGDDLDLATGFLFTEGLIRSAAEIQALAHCSGKTPGDDASRQNVVRVTLRDEAAFDPKRLERHFYATSSCGVCGKASLDALNLQGLRPVPSGGLSIDGAVLRALPEKLRQAQDVFDRTGGLHAAALFDAEGTLHSLREDVGRHNAVDKVIGHALAGGQVPLRDRVLLVSGRAGFELVQKAVAAGVPVMAAVGAPSSLAVELAGRYGMTLAGFLKADGFNVYTHAERIGS